MIKSLTLVAFLACALLAVHADNGDFPPADFGCDLCTAVIKDFTPELNTTILQDYFDRLCDDITTDFNDYDGSCKLANEASFTMVRTMIQLNESPKDICKTLGGCDDWDNDFLKKQFLQFFHKMNSGRFQKQLRMKQMLLKLKKH